MSISELHTLYKNTKRDQDALIKKYRDGHTLTRSDCLLMEKCNQRLHLVGHELWIKAGKPSDPEFDRFRQPHVKRPLPESFSLNLTNYPTEDIH